MTDSSHSPQSRHVPAPQPGEVGGPGATPAGDYDDAGVPTFEHVRDKIEGRYATALGSTELAEDSQAGRSIAQEQANRDAAARKRLEEIRRSVRGESAT